MQVLLRMLSVLALVFSVSVSAEMDLSAHQMVEKTTQEVIETIDEARGYIDDDPDRFLQEVDRIVASVVDFDSFARSVMGKYASRKYYQSLLTQEEKEAFKARVSRFSTVFREGLVNTYAMGLLAFNGQDMEILPPTDANFSKNGSVTVVQHIRGDGDKPYVVLYKMRKNRAGEWKLRNVTIEAINLGKVYQSQFYSAVQQSQGDLDKVIDNWSVEPAGSQGPEDA